ncbi:MAG: tRNA 2-thiouridine(34) synthase MnmA [Candidatus Sericytochromatia bacterium]
MSKRVAIAMSGGVDSSVTAALLTRAGYEGVGISMVIWPDSRCCNNEAMKDAGDVAAALGLPFHKFDFVETFKKKVVDNFTESYKNGLTPNPCAICNSDFKFLELFEMAKEKFGCDQVATGHYARVRHNPETDRYELLKALDPNKDQTYMLYALSQDQLSRVIFPVGEMRKPEVRQIAHELGFTVADKPESQDLCFSDDPQGFLRQQLGEQIRPGDIVDLNGTVVGQHTGIVNYTVGQRKGIQVTAPVPLYVIRIDAEANRLVVGPKEATLGSMFLVQGLNWVSIANPSESFEADVKIRYKSAPARAIVEPLADGRVLVRFFEPQTAISPGQVACFYDGDRLLAGGLIAKESARTVEAPAAAAV